MGIARAAVRIPSRSGLPRDELVNTFHFAIAGAEPTLAESQAIVTDLAAFYTTDPDAAAGVTAITAWMSSGVMPQPTVANVDVYGIQAAVSASGKPTWLQGSPNYTGVIAMGNGNADAPLPEEVAACVSFHGDLVSVGERIPGGPVGPEGDTRPRARRRGRVYIGRLGASCVAFANGRTTLATNFRLSLMNAALDLAASPNTTLVVASTTEGVGHPVLGGWVDDTFDTQRRRGVPETVRSTFVVP